MFKMTALSLETDNIRRYIDEIKRYYPLINLVDYQEEYDGIIALPCIINRLVSNEFTCKGCPFDFRILQGDPDTPEWAISSCARCSFIGTK